MTASGGSPENSVFADAGALDPFREAEETVGHDQKGRQSSLRRAEYRLFESVVIDRESVFITSLASRWRKTLIDHRSSRRTLPDRRYALSARGWNRIA
ncbi:hypothetical protein [Natronorarus salvus]|uniref:hypothetical protein n=1 Tax=Natronorarus salvus TaxID=3117733 RepID=UPI002F26AA0C